MIKKTLSLTDSRTRRLYKLAVKRARTARAARTNFLLEVKEVEISNVQAQRHSELILRARAARQAPFLDQYRVKT